MSHARLAPRMNGAGSSPTAEISNKVRALTAQGHAVVNLGEGELDFPTPEAICAAGIAAIEEGDTKYTAVAGTAALKAAIRAKFARENALDYSDEEVIAGAGAKQLIFNALLATLAPGEEVIVPAPYWVSYPDMVRLAEGVPVIVPCTPAQGWKLTPQALKQAITPLTRWVVLNSPNNPTGAVYSPDEMRALTEVLLACPQVLVLADDIYEHVRFEGAFATPAAVEPALRERTLTVNGLSKGYSMTGWRLGYAGGPAWLVAAMQVLQSQSTSNPSTISQRAGIAALEGVRDFMAGWLETLRTRRDIVLDMIARVDGLASDVPEGAFYVFADCRAMIGATTPAGRVIASDLDFATYLLEAAHVGVVHGAAFGAPGYIRIAYAVDTETLRAACRRIEAACRALSLKAAA
ncbi:pyridoxal phosphate-dependent aminotransferase [Ancylobacter mangrovi]|uniref:pyridoxal phosphate-dependent aminotransferase n=1 Tax=Ancylobacter mangrovi TaxID=2972472 RepID=UPI0021636BF9|nr:pyridoxal phosphate-dependent aminotransferase [Ancylobacter mangrovi]MCS0502765.1 pyridoxal phosphate-dependent aminotransferase [Ancylobacter mangrovi]